ncbi:TetR/AcrR family transcriptional regulator [Nocardioides speluncae]|uniref:TetR/AcrR family transcriptional regulator n=1 Tax=Nocardioides speluncae TaxID=2670337 RepID=UPI000D694554|nr:TetR/AcrR family transcriptional regulator [Nocardioides speluncae]
MNGTNGKSVYGDAEARRRMTLDAAAALLDEGGYAALTIRSVAQRAGTSTGLIYQYFSDKQEIFIALLNESQIESAAFVEALPRDQGVAALISQVIPHAAKQWGRVGRLTATWRTEVGDARLDRESVHEVRTTARVYNEALHTAIIEAAALEGRRLRDDAAVLPFVLSGILGMSDTLVNHWAPEVTTAELVDFTAAAITQGITAH